MPTDTEKRDERVQRWLEIPQDCIKTREGSWTYLPPNLRDERGMGLVLIALFKKGIWIQPSCNLDDVDVVTHASPEDTRLTFVELKTAGELTPDSVADAAFEAGKETQWK